MCFTQLCNTIMTGDEANMQENTILSFFVEYFATKSLDYIFEKMKRPVEEQDIEGLVYCMLTDSLKKFCNKYDLEFDERGILETFSFSLKRLDKLTSDDELKSIVEAAIEIEISSDEFATWIEIVNNLLVSDKYVKLYRALQLQNIRIVSERFVEPLWMQKNLIDNFFEIQFYHHNEFINIYSDIETSLSRECCLLTQQLLMELLFNAVQHGKAKQFSLLIEKNQISITDNGSRFNTHNLANNCSRLSGGNRTFLRYTQSFPDVKILYTYKDQKNCTTLSFDEPVFNVNDLCEIEIPDSYLSLRCEQNFHIRYPTSRAKYYYADFAKKGRFFWTISGVIGMLKNLISFCTSLDSEVFLHIPVGNEAFSDEDYFAEEMLECITKMDVGNKIHIVRD